MIATQSISKSDNFVLSHKKNTRLKHIITHSKYREMLLSKSMRPVEAIVALLSPLFFIGRMSQQGVIRLRRGVARLKRDTTGNPL
jgi:hypothetical protein